MSTFFRMALTATLALSASLSLVGSKPIQAEISEMADAFSAPQVASLSNATIYSEFSIEPSSNTFDPEPNDPPQRTGGSGTR